MDRDDEHRGVGGVSLVGNVLFGCDDEVARWVAQRIPSMTLDGSERALGVWIGGRLGAGVVYAKWNGVHCEASIAAEPGVAWASRAVLRALFYYPFVTMGCEAVSVAVAASNLPSLNLATKLGFVLEAIIAFAAPDGGPLLVLKMYRGQCRWIEDGQGEQRAAAT